MTRIKNIGHVFLLGMALIVAGCDQRNLASSYGTSYYPTGELRAEQFPVAGKRTFVRQYYKSGQLQSKWNYKDGQLDGAFVGYYKNGKVHSTGTYRSGEPHGLIRGFYESGELWRKERFEEGVRHGLSQKFYESGKVLGEGEFEYGTGTYVTYFESGEWKRIEPYVDGKIDGKISTYHENGNIFVEENYRGGIPHGTFKVFSPEGVLIAFRYYMSGKLFGAVKEFYETGQLKKIGHFIEGRQHGLAEEFYPQGQLLRTVPYVMDRIRGEVQEYHKNGALKASFQYDDDVLKGLYREYNEEGQLLWERTYSGGILDGVARSYYPGGELWYEKVYADGKLRRTVGYTREGAVAFEHDFADDLAEEQKELVLFDALGEEYGLIQQEEPDTGLKELAASPLLEEAAQIRGIADELEADLIPPAVVEPTFADEVRPVVIVDERAGAIEYTAPEAAIEAISEPGVAIEMPGGSGIEVIPEPEDDGGAGP